MRKLKFISMLAIAFVIASCGPKGEKTEAGDAQNTMAGAGFEYKADIAASSVEWFGSKPSGNHKGTISLKEGTITVKDGKITGGKIVMDMTTIKDIDLTDAAMNAKLVGHLKSPDFFNVDSFATATFDFTAVEEITGHPNASHKITGNLTIKGTSKSISFMAKVNVTDAEVTAVAPQFLIDRTEWDIRFKSQKFFNNLKDQFINDEIGLNFNFRAVK